MANETLQYSKDYDMFKLHSQNRVISKARVQKLKSEIQRKNLLDLFPVLVDRDNYILDGQHRFEACKQLGIEVAYKTTNRITIRDVSFINSVSAAWKGIDYIKYHAKNNDDYKLLLDIMQETGIKDYRNLTYICGHELSGMNTDFKYGHWQPTNTVIDRNRILNAVEDIKVLGFKEITMQRPLNVFLRLWHHDIIFRDRLMSQIRKYPEMLKKKLTKSEYQEMFVDIYNRNMATMKKIYYNPILDDYVGGGY